MCLNLRACNTITSEQISSVRSFINRHTGAEPWNILFQGQALLRGSWEDIGKASSTLHVSEDVFSVPSHRSKSGEQAFSPHALPVKVFANLHNLNEEVIFRVISKHLASHYVSIGRRPE